MKRTSVGFAFTQIVCALAVAVPASAQSGDGYIGIYSDSSGTSPCVSVPPMTGRLLYVIAKTAGASNDGISGAEFRIEVTNPTGWSISYSAPNNANIVMGNPIDTDPDPDAGGGVNVSFPTCQAPVAGNVPLGTIFVFNFSGGPTGLFVKRHSEPTNPGYPCPLFVACDPLLSKVCMTSAPPDSCTLEVEKATISSAGDEAIFTASLNGFRTVVPTDEHHPERILVWFKPGVVMLPPGRTAARLEEVSFGSIAARTALEAAGVREITMLTPTATLENLVVTDDSGTRPLDRAQLDIYLVKLADTSVSHALSVLRADVGNVREATPDRLRYRQFVPDDQLFSEQWWAQNTGQYNGVIGADVNAIAAWDRTTGLAQVDVVVIDTGVDAGHPDLGGRVINGPNYVGGGLPDDDDVQSSHGTSVSGIIAATGNNGDGVAGMDWNARIVRVKALDASGTGFVSDIMAAVDWARVEGHRIVNLSLGGPGSSGAEMLVYKNAYMAGMAVFAAMGNDNCACTAYPAGYAPFTIGVGAIMHTGVRWDDSQMPAPFVPGPIIYGSNTGPHIRFVAPGGRYIQTTRSRTTGEYWTLNPNLGFYGFGGTSAATPVATGVAALVQSLRPELTGEDLAQILSNTAVDLFPSGFDQATGWGRIDADAALAYVTGQNRIEQGIITSVQDVGQQSGFNRTIFNWPGIPNGTFPSIRHTIQGSASFNESFIAAPVVWPRQASSNGAWDENPIVYEGWSPDVRVTSINSSQVDFQAYVYDLRSPANGEHVAWWPTTPSGVVFAYTAIGPVTATDINEYQATRMMTLAAAPTPARSFAHLQFTLARPGVTSLAIYDVAGRLVRRLVAQPLAVGPHQYGWDLRSAQGQPVGSGVYFARLNTPTGTRVTRLVVMR